MLCYWFQLSFSKEHLKAACERWRFYGCVAMEYCHNRLVSEVIHVRVLSVNSTVVSV